MLSTGVLYNRYLVAMLCIIFASTALSEGQELQTALRQLDEQEQLLREYRIEWAFREQTKISPANAVQLEQRTRSLRHSMQAKGLPPPVVEQETASIVRQEMHATLRITQSRWIIEWGDNFLHVAGSRKLGDQTGDILFHAYYFSNGWLVEYPDPSASQLAMHKGGQIFCYTGEAYRYQSPDQGALDLLPSELALIAGLNPLRIGDALRWHTVKRDETGWVLETILQGPISPYRIQVHLNPQYGYALSAFTCWSQPDTRDWQVHGAVRYYKKVNRQWMPAKIIVEGTYLRGKQRRLRVWQLQTVSPASKVQVSIPSTMPVMDYRLAGCNLFSTQQMFSANEEGRTVSYRFATKIPDINELRQIFTRRTLQPVQPARSAYWWRFIPPILLIVIGALWYWKLKVKKAA